MSDKDEENLLRIVALQNAKSVFTARRRAERDLIEAKELLERKTEELKKSEVRYRTALLLGRMGNWETDYLARIRTWTPEGMALFGINLAEGRGCVGGETDEFMLALHPDDRHLAEKFHALADKQDSFPAEYRIVKPDGTIRWLSGRGQVIARDVSGKAHRLFSVVTDITEHKANEEHIKFMMGEISHRSKNLLSVVQAIALQTSRNIDNIAEFVKRFSLCLKGLAASHDLLVN